jgi:carbon starvation protein CstA
MGTAQRRSGGVSLMITASRILGDQVGSTTPVFLAFLSIHVVAGLTAVMSGAIAAVTRKGSSRHVRAGRLFYRAITIVFITAMALAIMRWRQDYHLFIIGMVAFTAATIGYLHRRRHRPGDTGHIVGMGTGYVAMLTAFYVDNGPHLPLWDRLPPLTFWFLPGIIGAPIIARAVIEARKRQARPDVAAALTRPRTASRPDQS